MDLLSPGDTSAMDPTDDQIEEMADEAHRLAMELTKGGGAPPLRRFIFTMRYNDYKPFLVAELNYHYGLSEGLFMGVFMERFDRMPTGREVDLMRRRADSYQAEVAESVEERTHARLARDDDGDRRRTRRRAKRKA